MLRAERCASKRTPRWYAIQVERGRERAMATLLTRVVPEGILAEPVFQPRFATEIKVRGSFVSVEKPLLEGYVIASARDAEALEKSLFNVVEFNRLLGTADGPSPLSTEEVALFGGLGEPGARVLPMSWGYKLADGSIMVERGPLTGREHLIVRVDRRKSTALLAVEVAGECLTARAGLAVLPVSDEDPTFARRLARRCARVDASRREVAA